MLSTSFSNSGLWFARIIKLLSYTVVESIADVILLFHPALEIFLIDCNCRAVFILADKFTFTLDLIKTLAW